VAAPSANQKTANTIAATLRQSGQLHQYTIDVVVRDGVAELRGNVKDRAQLDVALQIAKDVPGVERVVNQLAVAEKSAIQQVQGGSVPPPLPVKTPEGAGVLPDTVPGPGPGNLGGDPAPLGGGPAPGFSEQNPPAMPPYAWPTYAPYNNYSRVAYPTAYPYQAWPFIGPCYPFPKVPLGWRSVKLEWEDGYWWFSRVAHPYDWWHLRYW
jgi:hypothetical protein